MCTWLPGLGNLPTMYQPWLSSLLGPMKCLLVMRSWALVFWLWAILLRKHIHFRMSGGNGIKEREEFPKATWVFVSRKLVS